MIGQGNTMFCIEVYADQNRTLVDLEDVPQNLIYGVIATVDSKFNEHKGIRISCFIRAIVYGVFTSKQVGSQVLLL
jgi:membrane carboxypeptidase/penicillin-binding protein